MAVELGAAGATVYVTGRSTRNSRSPVGRPETIEDTAELVTKAGGTGIAVRCDHMVPSDVAALAGRIEEEQHGRLDVLVDDTWGAGQWIEWKPLWEHDLDNGLRALRNGLETQSRPQASAFFADAYFGDRKDADIRDYR
jgi:NAD(P)-dependent dehydrogenase (short-subunit alcohol dehydrogenase family)